MSIAHAFRLKPLCAAAALLAALAPHAAQASATTTATLSNVHIQLIDLDAADGVTPGITFGYGASTTGWINAMTQVAGVDVNDVTYVPVGMAFGPFGVVNGNTFAHGTLTAGDVLGASGPSVSVTAGSAGADGSAWGLAHALPAHFTLTANTRMVVTADFSTTLQSTTGDQGSTNGTLAGSGLDNTYWANDYAGSFSSSGFTSMSPKTSLQIAYDNAGASAYEGYLYVSVSATALSTTAVPEPQSVALMLAGLGLLGAIARRRRG